jgi:dolichyl-phosphate-mannose-protein mannosyltransferase
VNRPVPEAPLPATYEPRRPTLVATALLTVWVVVLSLPMLAGKWLVGPLSDQNPTGYAFRNWLAEELRRTGHVPLWNPEIFGGLPFVAAQHGDIFYPTSWLRVLLPTTTVMNFGFFIHYVLAGLFMYFLLRRLSFSWSGAVVGGLAYHLTGLIASYPSPGHDGKLFVSAALPLALLALVMALRERRWEGYGLLGLAVALALLSPHYQMTYYLLIASGLFALYLSFGDPVEDPLRKRATRLGIALAVVLVGFGVAMIQVLPFIHYIPYSPRAENYYGFEGATSYAIPWSHVPEFFLAGFSGFRETYWGTNGLKLHSEYLGLPVVALAALGVAGPRRRLTWWLGGIGLLFLLISLGAATPFYRVWWAVMPYVKQTRAPGMAFYLVGLVMAVFAAGGAERLERGEGHRAVRIWFGVAGVVLLLALAGGIGALAESLARANEPDPWGRSLTAIVAESAGAIRWGAVGSAVALALAAGLALFHFRGRTARFVLPVGLALVVGADLWRNALPFWTYNDARPRVVQPDPIIDRIKQAPLPYRVLDFGGTLGVYPHDGSVLMAFHIPQVLGHHGNELHRYDELLGGKNQWRNILQLGLWDLLAVRYVVVPAQSQFPDSVPGYRLVMGSQPTSGGVMAKLLERTGDYRYARVVPGALKVADDQTVPTLLDPRMDYSRLLLLDMNAVVETAPLSTLPPPSPSKATVSQWEPGRMTIALDPAPPQASYVLVSENWYPDWTATVDGQPAQALRGDHALIAVPVPTGARQVELVFHSGDYRTGKGISILSSLILLGLLAAPAVMRWKRRG